MGPASQQWCMQLDQRCRFISISSVSNGCHETSLSARLHMHAARSQKCRRLACLFSLPLNCSSPRGLRDFLMRLYFFLTVVPRNESFQRQHCLFDVARRVSGLAGIMNLATCPVCSSHSKSIALASCYWHLSSGILAESLQLIPLCPLVA